MSTRGFIGFVADGVEKISYCHNDAHPDGLGLVVLQWLREIVAAGDHGLTELATTVTALRVVDPASTPTPEDVDRYGRYADTLGSRSLDEWYALLRRTQDDPALILEAGTVLDASGFPAEPVSKWGYVIDTDTGTFEIYRGPSPHRLGRLGRPGYVPGDYPECGLFASWSFDLLPTDAEFLAALNETVPA
jgi:hypothetical protein